MFLDPLISWCPTTKLGWDRRRRVPVLSMWDGDAGLFFLAPFFALLGSCTSSFLSISIAPHQARLQRLRRAHGRQNAPRLGPLEPSLFHLRSKILAKVLGAAGRWFSWVKACDKRSREQPLKNGMQVEFLHFWPIVSRQSRGLLGVEVRVQQPYKLSLNFEN